MEFHLICERDVGLFSLFQQVIAHLPWSARKGRIPVVFFEGRCCYWVPGGFNDRSTVWEYYFEPLHRECPADSVGSEIRSLLAERFPAPGEPERRINKNTWASSHFGDHPQLKGLTLDIPYTWRDPDAPLRRRAARLIGQHVQPRHHILERVDAWFDEHMAGQKVIGVHIRGTDAASGNEDRAHRKDSLSLEHYEQAAAEFVASAPDARIFVATDDQRSLDFMVDAFGDRVLAFDSLRHQAGDVAGKGPTGWPMPQYVARDRTLAAQNGEEAVIEYLLLGRCAALVHNGSSLARTVLLCVPGLPHVNTHRKNRLIAEAQTLSVRSLRRLAKDARRHVRLSGGKTSIDG